MHTQDEPKFNNVKRYTELRKEECNNQGQKLLTVGKVWRFGWKGNI
jgi:hypothetical protein